MGCKGRWPGVPGRPQRPVQRSHLRRQGLPLDLTGGHAQMEGPKEMRIVPQPHRVQRQGLQPLIRLPCPAGNGHGSGQSCPHGRHIRPLRQRGQRQCQMRLEHRTTVQGRQRADPARQPLMPPGFRHQPPGTGDARNRHRPPSAGCGVSPSQTPGKAAAAVMPAGSPMSRKRPWGK